MTDKELTWNLAQAEADEDDANVMLFTDAILKRLDLPLVTLTGDGCKFTLTETQRAAVDIFVGEHFTS
jgi:hypothetical protein